MMKNVLISLILIPVAVHAQWSFDNSGNRIFDMRQNDQHTISITIESVDPKDLVKACDRRSRQLGFGAWNSVPMACAFWQQKSCHIIMPHRVDMRTVGHEIMHCFQGAWHD